MKQTIAETISAQYGDDGMRWRREDGLTLTEALLNAGARADWRDGHRTGDVVRYTLPDGSIITTAGDGWDFGYAGCYCWRGAGHDPEGCVRGQAARSRAGAVLGRKGGSAGRGDSKRRDVDYAALGRKGAAARKR